MKKTIGILAHVDAGKTTLSEQALLRLGALRRAGRVDHGDTLLDAHPLERARGITIFSGQAVARVGEDVLYWIDTPGHPDFVAEAERALPVLDAAVLLLSCADGLQSHAITLWRLLEKRGVPTFLFLNKCDLPGADADALIDRLQERLSENVVDARALQQAGQPDEALLEAIALRDDAAAERYLEGSLRPEEALCSLRALIRQRKFFPVMAGSALRGEGIDGFLSALLALTETDYDRRADGPFAARCWRVRRIDGQRVSFLKLYSGHLAAKDALPNGEKAHALYRVHGEESAPMARAEAGDLVAIVGPTTLRSGEGLGMAGEAPLLAPMMESDLMWAESEVPAFRMLEMLRTLEEEDPTLSVRADGGRLRVAAAGKLQLEVLCSLFRERWGQEVSFGPARVLYRESVAAPAVGIGHYEPLRHYAEVWLRLSPGKQGSGVTFVSRCSVNELALGWQRLIETHVFEREHHGVLLGAPITDVQVELLTGRAHLKHTEGGDFRQAVGRAMRHALMQAQSVVLEPICRYELRVPTDIAGRVSASLAGLHVEAEPPEPLGEETRLAGHARLAAFAPWQEAFPALTRGRGSLSLTFSHYAPCDAKEQARLVAESGYNPLADPQDTPDSVFCAHGAGYAVAWNRVRDFAHCTAP